MVEPVGGIAAVDVDPVGERKAVVRQAPRRDLPGRVIAKALHHIVRRGGAVEVVGQAELEVEGQGAGADVSISSAPSRQKTKAMSSFFSKNADPQYFSD